MNRTEKERELLNELEGIAQALKETNGEALLFIDLYYLAQRVGDIKQELRLERAKRI